MPQKLAQVMPQSLSCDAVMIGRFPKGGFAMRPDILKLSVYHATSNNLTSWEGRPAWQGSGGKG